MGKAITTLFTLTFLLCVFSAGAQHTYTKKTFEAQRVGTAEPKKAEPGFLPQLIHMEMPVPGGPGYRDFLMEQKVKIRELYPPKQSVSPMRKTQDAPQPTLHENFGTWRRYNNGLRQELVGGLPNDNTMALSNDSILLVAVNSYIWARDLKTDTFALQNQFVSLTALSPGGNSDHYDPKLLYDPEADRFILVYLEDRTPQRSKIVVAFSSTNHPDDPWYSYHLPGNPLDNNRWTDYPAICITNDKLYVTGNLIIPGEPWQIGFDGSVIWEVEKQAGFDGAATLPASVFSDIRYNGRFVRNIHTVRGAFGSAEAPFFLSNRNFDLTNDTTFFLTIDAQGDLQVRPLVADVAYGMPPNGRQENTDTTDPTGGLQTNDARVLGSFLKGDQIQFVANTVNPDNGLAAIYHGIIENVYSEPSLTASILGDETLDFGYPNIAFSGNEDCDKEAIIGVNFTSPTDYAGVGAFYFSNEGEYSDFLRIKDGENYIDVLSGDYDRWGDYFGIQRVYTDEGRIWISGFYGLPSRRSSTWSALLSSPDSMKLEVTAEKTGNAAACAGRLKFKPSGGIPPYSYNWLTLSGNSDGEVSNLCLGDTVEVEITDARGCVVTQKLGFEHQFVDADAVIYPNPATELITIQFTLETDERVVAKIFDNSGAFVAEIIAKQAKPGKNALVFYTQPLASGIYHVRLYGEGDRLILSEKIVKY